MLRLVLGAIRRRRTQALLLFLLGAVAATVAAAAPGYLAAACSPWPRRAPRPRHRASGSSRSTRCPSPTSPLLAVGLLCLALGGGGLGVAATVELRARADELRSLRRQGASRWVVARAGWQSYLVIVLTGAVVGAIAATVAWLSTRDSLPVVDRLVAGVPAPSWPGWTPVWAWAGATAVLALVAVSLTAALSGTVRGTRHAPGRPFAARHRPAAARSRR